MVTLMLSLTLVPVALAADDDKKGDKKSADGKKKAGKKKADKKSAIDEAVGDTEAGADEVGEPDPWEAPPEDEEKPPAFERKKKEGKKIGDGRRLTLGLLAGYGFETDNRSAFNQDPFGLGFGNPVIVEATRSLREFWSSDGE